MITNKYYVFKTLTISFVLYGFSQLMAQPSSANSSVNNKNANKSLSTFSCGQKGEISDRENDCRDSGATSHISFYLVTRNTDTSGSVSEFFRDSGTTENLIWGPSDDNNSKRYTWKEANDFCASLNPINIDGLTNSIFNQDNRNRYLGSLATNNSIFWYLPSKNNILEAGGNPKLETKIALRVIYNFALKYNLPHNENIYFWSSTSDFRNYAWLYDGVNGYTAIDGEDGLMSTRCLGKQIVRKQ